MGACLGYTYSALWLNYSPRSQVYPYTTELKIRGEINSRSPSSVATDLHSNFELNIGGSLEGMIKKKVNPVFYLAFSYKWKKLSSSIRLCASPYDGSVGSSTVL